MKRLSLILFALFAGLILASCGGQTSKNETKAIDAIEVTVDSLINDASALEGKTVRFIASIDHACMHGGKRLTVYGDKDGNRLKVEATETSPKFVSALRGKEVEVVGVVRKVEGAYVADCEEEVGNETPEFAYIVDCIDFKEK